MGTLQGVGVHGTTMRMGEVVSSLSGDLQKALPLPIQIRNDAVFLHPPHSSK